MISNVLNSLMALHQITPKTSSRSDTIITISLSQSGQVSMKSSKELPAALIISLLNQIAAGLAQQILKSNSLIIDPNKKAPEIENNTNENKDNDN
jgi:hypothetical protein